VTTLCIAPDASPCPPHAHAEELREPGQVRTPDNHPSGTGASSCLKTDRNTVCSAKVSGTEANIVQRKGSGRIQQILRELYRTRMLRGGGPLFWACELWNNQLRKGLGRKGFREWRVTRRIAWAAQQ
jgi:hypothetical protein